MVKVWLGDFKFRAKGFAQLTLQWNLRILVGCALVFVQLARADFDEIPLSTSSPAGTESMTGSEGAPAVPQTSPTPTPEAVRTPASAPAGSSGKEAAPAPTLPTTRPSTPGKSSSSKSAPQNSTANSDEGLDHNSSAPVSYSAQSLEGSLTQGRILLKGDVQIEQADAVMKSDVAEIFSNKGESTPQRAVAKGQVKLNKAATATTQELRAVANELEYFMRTRKVILKGKPKIWRGRELLQGEVIEVFLDTNEIKVRGARGVMDPSAPAPTSSGNSSAAGVQNAPVKKSSQSGRR